jgi:hypothetical protein
MELLKIIVHNPSILNSNANGYRDFFIDADNTVFASSTNGVVKIKNDSIVQVFYTKLCITRKPCRACC